VQQVARGGAHVEALVLFVAAGERGAGEIPGQAEHAGAARGVDARGAVQVAVEQRAQGGVGELAAGGGGQVVVRTKLADDFVVAEVADAIRYGRIGLAESDLFIVPLLSLRSAVDTLESASAAERS